MSRIWWALQASIICAASANAQEIPTTTPVLDIPEDIFVPTKLPLGSAIVAIGGTTRVEHDNNIYAQAYGGKSDTKFIIQPYLTLQQTLSTVALSAQASGDFTRYFRYRTENFDRGEIRGRADWSPTLSDKIVLAGGYRHGIEDRGEPEASTVRSIGPREFNSLFGDAIYTHQGPRLGFSLRGTGTTYNFDRLIDRARNLDVYAVVGRGSYRISPLLNGFVESFVTKRDFAPTIGEGGLDRDSNTYGTRIGVAIDPGGTLRGEAAVGLYQFDPLDDRLRARTGLSAQIGLILKPFDRIALTFDAFTGNVATYQAGASSRNDTRVRIGIQQEIRHNLRWQANIVGWRTRYFGTGLTQNIYAGLFEVEYIVNRRLIIASNVSYADRNSSAPLDGFSRLRTSVALKFHY